MPLAEEARLIVPLGKWVIRRACRQLREWLDEGLPEMRIPINDSFNVVSLPELSVYSRRDRVGVAEFSGFLYEPKTGAPLGAVVPMTGKFRIRSHKLLMVVAWGQQTIDPGERDPGDSWRQF